MVFFIFLERGGGSVYLHEGMMNCGSVFPAYPSFVYLKGNKIRDKTLSPGWSEHKCVI